MIKIKTITVICFFFLLAACTKPPVTSQKETVDYQWSDDLSRYRPKTQWEKPSEPEITETIANQPLSSERNRSDALNGVLDSIIVRNDSIRMYEGYTLLVYSGNNEIEAGRVRNSLYDLVPEYKAILSYKLPTYFVKVGVFLQQIEAQPLYRRMRKVYPTATIVPELFPLVEDQ